MKKILNLFLTLLCINHLSSCFATVTVETLGTFNTESDVAINSLDESTIGDALPQLLAQYILPESELKNALNDFDFKGNIHMVNESATKGHGIIEFTQIVEKTGASFTGDFDNNNVYFLTIPAQLTVSEVAINNLSNVTKSENTKAQDYIESSVETLRKLSAIYTIINPGTGGFYSSNNQNNKVFLRIDGYLRGTQYNQNYITNCIAAETNDLIGLDISNMKISQDQIKLVEENPDGWMTEVEQDQFKAVTKWDGFLNKDNITDLQYLFIPEGFLGDDTTIQAAFSITSYTGNLKGVYGATANSDLEKFIGQGKYKDGYNPADTVINESTSIDRDNYTATGGARFILGANVQVELSNNLDIPVLFIAGQDCYAEDAQKPSISQTEAYKEITENSKEYITKGDATESMTNDYYIDPIIQQGAGGIPQSILKDQNATIYLQAKSVGQTAQIIGSSGEGALNVQAALRQISGDSISGYTETRGLDISGRVNFSGNNQNMQEGAVNLKEGAIVTFDSANSLFNTEISATDADITLPTDAIIKNDINLQGGIIRIGNATFMNSAKINLGGITTRQ